MRITPLDIQQQRFKRVWRGFEPREVEAFLEMVANELESLLREHHQTKEEFTKLSGQLADLTEREKILRDTLITAQKATVDIKNNAHKESEVIVRQAEVQAEKIINMANQRLARLIDEIQELKRQRALAESDLKAVLDRHYKLLEAIDSDRQNEKGIEENVRVLTKPT